MFDSVIFRLIVLAALIAYLRFSMEKRLRADEARWLTREREKEEAKRKAWRSLPPGAGFDVSAVMPRIQRLRQDHLAALNIRPHQAFYRRGLIAVVRQVVTGLSFFQRARSEHEIQNHDA
jgi:hypothetical protein